MKFVDDDDDDDDDDLARGTVNTTQTYCLREQYRDTMNAEQVSLTHCVLLSLSIQIPEHKRLPCEIISISR